MRKIILTFTFLTYLFSSTSCSSGNENLSQEEETEVNDMIKRDQEKLDSMKKALEKKSQTNNEN
ncbi:MAG: hypothetical protein J5I91_06315 [Bacteroidetes bacterium]|nr:hypothetical protein [Bacteroidota bacterium]